jgi:HEAT repeat protein
MDKKWLINVWLILCVFLCVLCDSVMSRPSLARADFDPLIDSPMYHIPDVPMPPVVNVFPEGLKELWLRALERPEADVKCKMADAIAQAHLSGLKGLETTAAPLIAALDRSDQHPSVRLAIARALIVLEARESAPVLFRQAQTGTSDLRELVEPALARWDYRPARAVWLERLREPATRQRNLILAIQGLATVREERAVDRLREMVLADRVPGPIRLESARALGSLRGEGLEKDAERLAADASPRGLVPRLAAGSLLLRHSSPEAVQLLQRLTRDSETAVAAIAASRLLEIDPQLLVAAVEHLLARPDASLRSYAVDVLGRRPSAKHLHLLGDRLDDEHIRVRIKARRYLEKLAAEKKWRDLVLAEGTRILQTEQWRGLEQATILLTQLDHKPAVGRVLELLAFNRPEVSISAAWGVRKLDVPETLPRVLSYVDSQVQRLSGKASAQAGQGIPAHLDEPIWVNEHSLSQLNQFFGQRKYRAADAVLRKFIPKATSLIMGAESRAAAIWALGLIHEGEMIDDLATALEERLEDVAALPPEDNRVRLMSAFALGRMKAKRSLPSLRKYFALGELSREPVNNACGWAIAQITGAPLPPGKSIRKMQRNWFLIPQP